MRNPRYDGPPRSHPPQLLAWTTLALWLGGCAGGSAPSTAPTTPPAATNQAATPPQAPPLDWPNARYPLDGVLTGGRPDAEDVTAAHAAGYRTIISLLPDAADSAEAAQAEALGMRFVAIPVAGAGDLTPANARALDAAMGAPDAAPVVIHCGSGNRVGALLALRAHWMRGVPAAEALQQGRDAGLSHLEPATRERLGLPQSPP